MTQTPDHLSFSSISAYGQCAKRWQLERVVKVPQSAGWANIGGSGVHAATEAHDGGSLLNAQQLFDMAFDEAIDEAKKDDPDIAGWRAANKGREGQDWWREHGPQYVQKWIDWRRDNPQFIIPELPEGPGIELELHPVIAGVEIKMFIDRLMVLPSGDLLVLDIKTGKWEPDPLQLAFYAEGIWQHAGIRVARGAFWNPRKDKPLSELIPLAPYTPNYLGELVVRTMRGIEADEFKPRTTALCKGCSVRHACFAVGGKDAAEFDPDFVEMPSD